MGQFAVPLMIASTVFSTVGAVQQAQAQKAEANYTAAIQQNNAIIADQRARYNQNLAEDARKRGATDEWRTRLQTSALASSQRNAFAASGVDGAYGSPLDILSDTYYLGELDALTVRNNADREAKGYEYSAWGDKIDGQNARSASQMAKNQAKQISPLKAGFTSLLDGATTVSSKWYQPGTKTPWYK